MAGESRTTQLAKLSRPRLYDALPRERLFALLDKASEHPAVWIAAPPGAGKTTLVAGWLENRGKCSIWYQVDAGDADPASFFYYLGVAELARPGRPRKLRPLPLLTPEHLADLPGFARLFFRELFGRLGSPAVLVLDNYQEAGETPFFHDAVRIAIDNAPRRNSIVIVSRTLPYEDFALLRANKILELIEWEPLKLTREETGTIGQLHASLSEQLLDHLYERSGGWAAGLILLVERLQRGGAGIDEFSAPESLHEVFGYFAGQLFDRADADTRRVLLLLSYLPNIPASIADVVTGNDNAARLLEKLYRRHLFTDRRRGKEPVYQFHALFRAFLQHRAQTDLDSSQQMSAALHAAQVLVAAGHFEDAMGLRLAVGDWDGAEKIILDRAPQLIAQGRWRIVEEWISALPPLRVESNCWLLHWRGTATTAIDPRNARKKLEEGIKLAEIAADELCEIRMIAAIIGTYMVEYTHFQPLDRWIAKLEQKATASVLLENAELELRVQSALLIALAFRRPGSPRIMHCVERVFDLLKSDIDINLRVSAATYLLRYGGTTGPLAVGRRALLELDPLLRNPEVAAYNSASALAAASWFHCLCRNRSQCMETSAEAVRIAVESGLSSPAKLALINRMWLALFEFDAVEGRNLLERVEPLVNHAHPFDVASLHGARAWIALGEGRLENALDHGLKAVSFFDEAGSTMHRINFRLGLVTILVACRQFDAASLRIAEVREIAGDSITFWQCNALSASEASIALEEDNLDLARERFRAALVFARKCGDDFSFANWCRPWMPRLCQEAMKAEIEVPYVQGLIRRYGFSPPSSDVAHWPWLVKVYVLGRFRVLVDDRVLSFSRKTPRKPLELLKAIIALGSRDVREQKLADMLWPGDDGDAAHRSLTTALYRLRNLIGDKSLIRQQDAKISLDTNRMWIDVLAFEACSALEPEPDIVKTMRAVELYRGKFMAHEDAPWAVSIREKLRARYVDMVTAAARRFEREGRHEEALDLYRRGIEADELAETFHQGLMRCHHQVGRTPEALDAYRRMRELLTRVHGVQPSPATEDLYRKISSR